jgi:3-deoxy-D-arabino-heptulosonate 7-phosphate (DAHP) synthase
MELAPTIMASKSNVMPRQMRGSVRQAQQLFKPVQSAFALCCELMLHVRVWRQTVLYGPCSSHAQEALARAEKAERLRAALMREMSHRIKNKLQFLASTINLHARTGADVKEVVRGSGDCQGRRRPD